MNTEDAWTLIGNIALNDLVTWLIGGKLDHIGIVTHKKSSDGKRPLIVHNIGGGQILEDCLLTYNITGHYRFIPNK